MRLPRIKPAWVRILRCSLAVGAVMPSFAAMKRPQTPSFTRSPSVCGGKWASGFFSQLRMVRRRSLASALMTPADSILDNLPFDELQVKAGAVNVLQEALRPLRPAALVRGRHEARFAVEGL